MHICIVVCLVYICLWCGQCSVPFFIRMDIKLTIVKYQLEYLRNKTWIDLDLVYYWIRNQELDSGVGMVLR